MSLRTILILAGLLALLQLAITTEVPKGAASLDFDGVEAVEMEGEDDHDAGHTHSHSSGRHSHDEEEYDSDEFVGVPIKKDSKGTVKAGGAKKPDAATDAEPKKFSIFSLSPQDHFYYEIAGVAFIVVYLINFFIGKRKNQALADAWIAAHLPVFEEEFAVLHDGEEVIVKKDTQNIFNLYFTGRDNCIGVSVTITLMKRHDLFMYLFDIFTGVEDSVGIDVRLDPREFEPYVFAVLPAKKEKFFRKEIKDLGPTTTMPSSGFKLTDKLTVVTDCDEAAVQLLGAEVVTALNKYDKFIHVLHVTDSSPFVTHKAMIHAIFRYSDTTSFDKTAVLARMIIFLIDETVRVKMSKTARQRSAKIRQAALEEDQKKAHEQRQEKAQEIKAAREEKQRAERDAAFARLKTPEEQRKFLDDEDRAKTRERQKQASRSRTLVMRA